MPVIGSMHAGEDCLNSIRFIIPV